MRLSYNTLGIFLEHTYIIRIPLHGVMVSKSLLVSLILTGCFSHLVFGQTKFSIINDYYCCVNVYEHLCHKLHRLKKKEYILKSRIIYPNQIHIHILTIHINFNSFFFFTNFKTLCLVNILKIRQAKYIFIYNKIH